MSCVCGDSECSSCGEAQNTIVPKTVSVRIAVGVDSSGGWVGFGAYDTSDADSRDTCVDTFGDDVRWYVLTGELPVPVKDEEVGGQIAPFSEPAEK